MRWSEFMTDYFTFTRKERIGILALVLLILVIWIIPNVISPGKSKSSITDTSWITAAKQLQHPIDSSDAAKTDEEALDEMVYDRPRTIVSKTKAELFYFDPNHLSPQQWEKLGIPERTRATIQKYLQKGGHFFQPNDLKKIYGIHADEFARLEPYIKIESSQNQIKSDAILYKTATNKQQKPRYDPIDINTADTSALIALPGIGSKLASRIISFREKLGGFYTVDQVSEIYGLPDSTFEKIKGFLKIQDAAVKKININTATKDELKSHPYIRWNLANAIVEYRTQHGNFSSLEDLKKISVITEEVFLKIRPYTVVQ
jgi:competence protein ComEA